MKLISHSIRAACFLAALIPGLLARGAPAEAAPNVKATLVAEDTTLQPGTPAWVGIRLDMAPHWHTYWKNPGDAGLPTKIEWSLPDGFGAAEIVWPIPIVFPFEGLANYGYETRVLLMVPLEVPASAQVGSTVELKAEVSWLACKEVCIPGGAEVRLSLPVQAGPPQRNEQNAALFEATRAAWPKPADGWQIRTSVDSAAHQLVLHVQPPGPLAARPESLVYFPVQEGVFDYAATQQVVATESGFNIRVPLSPSGVLWPDTISGLIVAAKGWNAESAPEAIDFSLPFERSAAVSGASPSGAAGTTMTLLPALLFAFVGGLILNLMPCVFPVISLKILGFVNQAGSDPRKVWIHGLVFALGVMVCFWALAGLLLLLKAGGSAIGWGFQLQSPAFVVAVAAIFLLLALNLFGVFEIGTSWGGIGSGLEQEEGLQGSFLSGMLATIVATPCTAPFMGSALGFALAQPAVAALAVFTALGLGMATPYLLLSRFPGWLRHIPKPGAWMESLKQGMGFILLAFALYLVWVYVGLRKAQADAALLRVLSGLLAVGVGGWVLGRWGSLARASGTRWMARAVCLAFVAGGAAWATTLPPTHGWIPYDSAQVERLVMQGKPVFVDFTAKWCVTCQANKAAVLNTEGIQKRFEELGVTLMQADWTDKNENIARVLAGFGRSGVPVYLLYGTRSDGQPILLPEILTKGIVLDALDKLTPKGD